jgi:hypothetical protein
MGHRIIRPASLPTRQVVYQGDSITRDYHPYCQPGGADWWAYNPYVSSKTIQTCVDNLATELDARYRSYQDCVCAVLLGGGDLALGATPADTFDALTGYCQTLQARGWKVVVGALACRGSRMTPANWQALATTLNGLIVAGWADFADALADSSDDPYIGDAGDPDDTTYFYDTIHMNAPGRELLAGYFQDAVDSLF